MTLDEAIRKLIGEIRKSHDADDKSWNTQLLAWLIELEQVQRRKEGENE